MGNSLLDIIVFGRVAGIKASKRAKEIKSGKLTLDHVRSYHDQLTELKIKQKTLPNSPIILPDYRREETKAKSLDVM